MRACYHLSDFPLCATLSPSPLGLLAGAELTPFLRTHWLRRWPSPFCSQGTWTSVCGLAFLHSGKFPQYCVSGSTPSSSAVSCPGWNGNFECVHSLGFFNGKISNFLPQWPLPLWCEPHSCLKHSISSFVFRYSNTCLIYNIKSHMFLAFYFCGYSHAHYSWALRVSSAAPLITVRIPLCCPFPLEA